MSDPSGFEPTERRGDTNDPEPQPVDRDPADDQPDSGDYSVPTTGTDEET